MRYARVAQSVGNNAPVFVGLEDEGHDQNPGDRAEQVTRFGRAVDFFNRTGRQDLFRDLL